MNENKLQDISFMKTVMMITIVLYHSCLFFGNNWFTYVSPTYNAEYLYIFAKWLNTFHIYVFVMASGYLFYFLKIEKNKYNNPKADIIKRARRLLIPYFSTCILWVIPITTIFDKYSVGDIINKYLLCKSPSQLWFLIMLFLVFIIFEFFADKIKVSKINLFIIYSISTLMYCIIGYLDIDYFQLPNVFKAIPFFYLGGYLYKYKDSFSTKKNLFLITCFIILLPLIYFLKDNTIIYKIVKIYTLQLFSTIEVILIYLGANYLIDIKDINIRSKVYKILENNSFGIFLFHQQIIYFCIISFNGVVHPIIQALLSFFIATILSLSITLLLKMNRFTKTMFGLQ